MKWDGLENASVNMSQTYVANIGTKDGTGAADNNIEYTFGQPKSYLKERQIARLLLLRGRIQDGDFLDDDRAAPAWLISAN